jgi:glycosyltransferase involved in cell wall biosynthesis
MKISILAPDLSHNSIGRAYILAKILQRRYDVEIVGPILKKRIWAPVINDKNMKYSSLKFCGNFISIPGLKKLYSLIDGDVIYVIKPLFNSFTVGLIKKVFTKKPLILDIDDWELGFSIGSYKDRNFIGRLFYILKEPVRFILNPNGSFLWKIINEKMVKYADRITVSDNFLKGRFGGVIIYHARDTDTINPKIFDKGLLKQKYGINKKSKVIMFFGTPRKYKGVDDLVEAVFLIRSKDIILFIVGIDEEDKYCKVLVEKTKERLLSNVRIFGLQPFEKIPEFLSFADIVVIPQRRSYSTIGQIPAKVFDAMAMAKPIIATDISGLSEILDRCGWVVEPGDTRKLTKMIEYVLSNHEEAKEMGLRAREKCINEYSFNATEVILSKIFKEYE